MVILVLVSIPISLINLQNHLAVLTLLSGQEYLSTMAASEISTKVMFYLDLHHNGNLIAQIFWGLWLLPFGYLVYKSGFLPKALGILLMIGCFGYLSDSIGYYFPGYGDTLIPTIVGIPSGLGEIGTALYLLIKGIKN